MVEKKVKLKIIDKEPSNKVIKILYLSLALKSLLNFQETYKIHAISLCYEIHTLKERLKDMTFKADYEKNVNSKEIVLLILRVSNIFRKQKMSRMKCRIYEMKFLG